MAHAQCGDIEDDTARVRDACEKCGATMKLVRIVPDRPGHEIRTWRCAVCEAEKIDRVAIG